MSAEIELRKMQEIYPIDPSVLDYLRIAAEDKDKSDEARDKFETVKDILKKSIQNDPNNPVPRKILLDIFFDWGYYGEAEKECLNALTICPEDPEFHYKIGNILYKQEKFEAAVKEYKAAIDLDPNNPEYHYSYGFALVDYFGYYDAGVKEIEKAIEIMPDEACCLELSYLFGLNEKISKYIELWQKLLETTGSNEARKYLEALSLSSGYEKSILDFIECLKNTSVSKFDIFINDQKISVIENSKAPETTKIREEDSRFIKAFNCYIGDKLFRIFVYYSIRPSQGYMIYISFNNPSYCRMELNISKMLKSSQPNQIDFSYNLLFTCRDGKNKNIDRKEKGLEACKNMGLDYDNNEINLGSYSIDKRELNNKTYEYFLKNIVKLSLIKGHFSNIIHISSLPEINEIEDDERIYDTPKKRERKSILSKEKLSIDESDVNLLSSVKEKMFEIREFTNGSSVKCPSNDKLSFWLWFCYEFGLYQEGAILFRKIDKDSVSPDLYKMVRDIGMACERRLEAT